MKMQCVVNTYLKGYYGRATEELEIKLKEGWVVKHVTPIVENQSTRRLEYILEKED